MSHYLQTLLHLEMAFKCNIHYMELPKHVMQFIFQPSPGSYAITVRALVILRTNAQVRRGTGEVEDVEEDVGEDVEEDAEKDEEEGEEEEEEVGEEEEEEMVSKIVYTFYNMSGDVLSADTNTSAMEGT